MLARDSVFSIVTDCCGQHSLLVMLDKSCDVIPSAIHILLVKHFLTNVIHDEMFELKL